METTMFLQSQKNELIRWLQDLEDVSVINKIFTLKRNAAADWWEKLSEAEKDSIERGLKDTETGNTTPRKEIKKIYEKWL